MESTIAARPVHIPPTSDPNTDCIQISDFINLSLELKREYASHYDLPNATQLSSDKICALLGENAWIPALKRHVWIPRSDLQGVMVSNDIDDLHQWSIDYIVRSIAEGPYKFRAILNPGEVCRALQQQWEEAHKILERQGDILGKGKAVLKEMDASSSATQQLPAGNPDAGSSGAAEPVTAQALLAVARRKLEYFAQVEAARPDILGDIMKNEQDRINRGNQDPVPSASTSAFPENASDNWIEGTEQASQAVMAPVASTSSSRAVATKGKARQGQNRAVVPARRARQDDFIDKEAICNLMKMIKEKLLDPRPPSIDAVEPKEEKSTSRRARALARRRNMPTRTADPGPSTVPRFKGLVSPFSIQRTSYYEPASETTSQLDDPLQGSEIPEKTKEERLAERRANNIRLGRAPSYDEVTEFLKASLEAQKEIQDIAALHVLIEALKKVTGTDDESDRIKTPKQEFTPSADEEILDGPTEDIPAPPSSEEMVYLACVLRGKPSERSYAMLDALEAENQPGPLFALFEGFKSMLTGSSWVVSASTRAVVAGIQSVFGFGRSTLKRTRADEAETIPELGTSDRIEATAEEDDYATPPRRKRARFEAPESSPSRSDSPPKDLSSSPTLIGGSSSPVAPMYATNGMSSNGSSMSSISSPIYTNADEVQRTPSASQNYIADVDEPSTPSPARRVRSRYGTPASRRSPRRSNRLN